MCLGVISSCVVLQFVAVVEEGVGHFGGFLILSLSFGERVWAVFVAIVSGWCGSVPVVVVSSPLHAFVFPSSSVRG